jgi:hypothetical protein
MIRPPVLAADAPRPRGCAPSDTVVIRRYLAARAFASWLAYEGGGMIAVLRSLRLFLSTVREFASRMPLKEAIRETDRRLLHLTPRDALARMVGAGRSQRSNSAITGP